MPKPPAEPFTPPDRLLTEREAAFMVAQSDRTLEKWRQQGKHRELTAPLEEGGAVRHVDRGVRYLQSRVLAWIVTNTA